MKPLGEDAQHRKRSLPQDETEYLNIYSGFLQAYVDESRSLDESSPPSEVRVHPPAQAGLTTVESQAVNNNALNTTLEATTFTGVPDPLVGNERDSTTASAPKRSPSIPFRSLTREVPKTRPKRRVRPPSHLSHLFNGDRSSYPTERRLIMNEHSLTTTAINTEVEKDNRPFSYIPTILDSSLDPFFELPDNVILTPSQKSYIHLYFKDLSPIVFGTTSKALYCCRYTVGYHTARYSTAGIMWLIVVAMQCANAQRGVSSDRALQAQIQSAFVHLHAAIQNARENPVGACLALMYANLADVAAGTNRLQGLYTTAIESVVEAAGGLKKFQRLSPLSGVYLVAVYTFLSHRPRSLKELETVKLRWMGSIFEVQQQLLRIRDTLRQVRAHLGDTLQPPSTQETEFTQPDAENTPYLADDVQAFSSADSEMMPLLRAMIMPRAGTGYMPRTSAIYIMHELIWALVDFGGKPEHMKRYHKRLNFLTRHSLVGGVEVASTSYMAAGMATLIVARARQETYQDMIGAEDEDVKLERTRTSIDSLKMYAALRGLGREIMLDTFRSWVLDIADISKPLKIFSDEEMATLGGEALENWFENED